MIRFQAVENRANFYTRDQQVKGMQGDPGDPGVSVSDATIDSEGHLILTLSDGTVIDAGMAQGESGDPGEDGQDGVSPTVTVTAITGGYSITITDASGDHAFALYNGEDGQDGEDGEDGDDGVSPSVSVSTITGGHSVTITDATGDHSFNVMDGEDGASDWSDITNTPTTLSGYGITDAVSSSQGSGHAGEFLVVGNDGTVTTQAFSVMTGGSY